MDDEAPLNSDVGAAGHLQPLSVFAVSMHRRSSHDVPSKMVILAAKVRFAEQVVAEKLFPLPWIVYQTPAEFRYLFPQVKSRGKLRVANSVEPRSSGPSMESEESADSHSLFAAGSTSIIENANPPRPA